MHLVFTAGALWLATRYLMVVQVLDDMKAIKEKKNTLEGAPFTEKDMETLQARRVYRFGLLVENWTHHGYMHWGSARFALASIVL